MALNDKRLELSYVGTTQGLGHKFFDTETGEFRTIEPYRLIGQSILVFGEKYRIRQAGASYVVEGTA